MTFNVVVRDENGEIAFDANSKTMLGVGVTVIPAGQGGSIGLSALDLPILLGLSASDSFNSFYVPEFLNAVGSTTYYPSVGRSVVVKVRRS